MARLHSKGTSGLGPKGASAPGHKTASAAVEPNDSEGLMREIQAFVAACRCPAAVEFGDEVMRLRPDGYALEVRANRVWIDVWDESRTLSRRILAIENRGTGSLDCAIHRFGGSPGKLSFLDLERPQTASRALAASRRSFGGQFRRMLSRQFPGWAIAGLSSSMDLQRSLSPLFPRARLSRGSQQIAAIACPSLEMEPEFLTFAMLWFDHVRASAVRKEMSTRLCAFLPEDAGCLTANRLHWLDGSILQPRIFRFNGHGSAGEVDPRDLGNLDTRVASQYVRMQFSPEISGLVSRLAALDGIGMAPEIGGSLSVRSRGVEFARIESNRVWLGIETKQEVAPAALSRVEEFACAAAALSQTPGAAAESWLECVVRSKLTAIDPLLREEPVHGQVLSFAGGDRDLIDLLAVRSDGSLAVIELKASEDIHLPMQALDYWIRIYWHAQRGELDGLFPGVPLLRTTPKLFLVAPAISFHSANGVVLRHFSPEVDVERVGVNSDWSRELKVVLRLKSADLPQSHGSFYEHARP